MLEYVCQELGFNIKYDYSSKHSRDISKSGIKPVYLHINWYADVHRKKSVQQVGLHLKKCRLPPADARLLVVHHKDKNLFSLKPVFFQSHKVILRTTVIEIVLDKSSL